jgi:hypothetical protein
MRPEGFEPAIPANQWPQIHALESTATAVCLVNIALLKYITLHFAAGSRGDE